MKPFKKITFVISLFLLMYACSEEWLKPEPLSFFSPENVYVDKAGFESLIVTLRKDLKMETHDYMNNIAQEFPATDLASPWSQLDFHKVTPAGDQYYHYVEMFTDIYGAIKNTNVVISRIDNIKWDSDAERNAILAEALWFRSYWYYRLVHSYGDVPFIGAEVTEPKLDYQTHSRKAILKKLQADLEFAAQWLPVDAEIGAVTKGAADHLLTKVYLANLEFDKAIEAATKVINGPYALMKVRFGSWKSDPVRNLLWDLHRPENINLAENTEAIMTTIDRFEAPANAKSSGLFTMRFYGCSWYQSGIRDSQGKPGTVASGLMYDTLGRGNANGRPSYYYNYILWKYGGQTWQNTQDLRRSNINWIDIGEYIYNNPASVDYGKPIQVQYLASRLDTFNRFYAVPHYLIFVPHKDPNVTPVGDNGDAYIFRLAETYLLRAEAYYWKNQLSDAAADINMVRERSNAIPVEPGEVTIDFIFDERGRELFTEEPRHSELVRVSFIMAEQNLGGYSLSNIFEKNYYHDRTIKYNSAYKTKVTLLGNTADLAPFHIFWPIADAVITANTKGVVNQNTGYTGAENNIPPIETIE